MLIRLLILIIFTVVIYRALKNWIGGGASNRTDDSADAGGQVDDIMIQDPVCGTYFVRRKGVSVMVDQQRFDFCSERCRDRYLAQHTSSHDSQSS
jgi:hypothetical protein